MMNLGHHRAFATINLFLPEYLLLQAPWAGGHLADGASKGPGDEGGRPEEEEEPETNPFYQVYRYYSSDKKSKPTSDIIEKLNSKFKKRLDKMKMIVEKVTKPDGTFDYPARTCRDLFAFNPTLKSGKLMLAKNRHRVPMKSPL